MESPGIGLLGYGFMGRAHAHALRTIASMTGPPMITPRLVTVAGRNAEGVGAMARRFGFRRHTSDWRDVVADPEVDVFHNLGPNALHAEASVAAARAGKAVVCEKPLGRNAAEAHAMLQAVREAGVAHMCAFNYRFAPGIQRARVLLESGALGDVRHVRLRYLQSWGDDPQRAGTWRFDVAQAGGGALGDLASHLVDLARHLVGEVSSVSAEARTFVPGRAVDDAVACAVTFRSGAIGTLEATRFATGNLNVLQLEVNGSRGRLEFDLERLNELVVDGRRELVTLPGWWPPGHVLGWEHTFVLELRRFLDAVAGRVSVGPAGATFEDGWRAAEVCDAIALSAAEGRRVELGARPARAGGRPARPPGSA